MPETGVMMPKDVERWFERLFASRDINSAAKVLAAALGHAAGGESAGVFLLDEAKSHLLLFASWTAAQGEKIESLQPVSVNERDDPLCYSLLCGAPYQADLEPTATMRLLHSEPGSVFASPLQSRTNGSLGGVLVTTPYGKPIKTPAPLRMLGLYASSLIENMILKKTGTSIVSSLRNDIAWLEKQKQQERELAATKIVGTSEAISNVRSLIIKAAPSNATVLITGETGTGKELTAEAIHSLSPRKNAPLMKINCGALSPHLLESELFGHVKGSFTGADVDHPGLLRSAEGGSVLLDEIGDMPPDLQVKLLRVLQDRKVRPVGDSRDYPVDIRIIAATNRNLREAMARGSFRKDLYHRLAALRIHIPPLRDRRQDIPVLAVYFFEKLCRDHGREGLILPLDACMRLSSLPLEGNARELANEIERTLLLSDAAGGCLSFNAPDEEAKGQKRRKPGLAALLRGYETDLITRSLFQHGGNISKTAEALGLPRSTLRAKLKNALSAAARTQEIENTQRPGARHGYPV
jgi:sigma-54-dependent transcriptional regulator